MNVYPTFEIKSWDDMLLTEFPENPFFRTVYLSQTFNLKDVPTNPKECWRKLQMVFMEKFDDLCEEESLSATMGCRLSTLTWIILCKLCLFMDR